MTHLKLQLGCLIILFYIGIIYFIDCKKYNNKRTTLFNEMLLLGIISIILDGATVYTVNNLGTVSPILNKILHILFLISLDTVIFVLYIYMLKITGAYPKEKIKKSIILIPYVINVILVIANADSLEYIKGNISNYSMGLSAYTCFAMAAIYIILTIITFFNRWNYIESSKRASILTYLFIVSIVTGIQMIFPDILISSIAETILIIGVYINLEAPALKELSRFHREMVMGFANLIENRDESTGGHIKRTSIYVQLIAEELLKKGLYSNVLTKDYINNIINAAPMHDIGKISIPDAILQKPGKLTDNEFEIMKSHAKNGGKIIQDTFKNFSQKEYLTMAYEVATFHHEKWNGKGYPKNLKQNEIPLCARIMAVADVFDAVSEKRCYRDAMPLNKCFEIIEKGKGTDFDPTIVQAFLDIRSKVEQVHKEFEKKNIKINSYSKRGDMQISPLLL